jgi:cytoskeletal protein CcmA (bactofilin family)
MTDPITIIGSNTVVSGNLEGDEDLTVEGRVEGSINLSKTLSIEVGGVVRANINVRNAVISGVLVGNVEAQESVHLTEQGRVVGDIVAPRVILVDGSSFRGNIDMGEFDIEQSYVAPESAPARYTREENEEEEAPAPVRVRRPAPAARPAPRPAAKKAPARKAPAKKAAAKKKPPAPRGRSVGKTKAKRKR